MKKIFLITYILTSVVFVFAQQHKSLNIPPNALFYDINGYGVTHATQAAYYRLTGRNDAGKKVFYDYYITGQLKAEKQYITIDKINDRKTILDGICRTFFKSGRVESIMQYKKGIAHGRAVSFYPTGKVSMKLNYENGVLNGNVFIYNKNGNIENTTKWYKGRMIDSKNGGEDSYINKTTKIDLFCNRYKADEPLIMKQAKSITTKQNSFSHLKEPQRSVNKNVISHNNKAKPFSFSYLYNLISNTQYQTNSFQVYDNIALSYNLNIAQVIKGFGSQKELIYHYNMDYDENKGVDRITGNYPRQIGFYGTFTNNQLTIQRINLFTWSKEEMLCFANDAIKEGYHVLGGDNYLMLDGNFVLEPKRINKSSGTSHIVISFIHKSNLYAGLYHIQMDLK